MDKKIEASNRDKVYRRVAKLLKPLGYVRTKTTFFTQASDHFVRFVHLHKFTFAPAFRVHLGIRVLNDEFVAPALNGPDSDPYACPNSPNGKKYHFDFHKSDDSVEKCAQNIAQWCAEVRMPWFDRFSSIDSLLNADDSPLDDTLRMRLRDSLAGRCESTTVERSLSLLGVAQH